MDGSFCLSCLKILLTNFTAEHEELRTHNTRQAMLPGLGTHFTTHLQKMERNYNYYHSLGFDTSIGKLQKFLKVNTIGQIVGLH